MQATITYLLSEQAQRAQMVATGQPVARKQVKTVEITMADLAILDLDADGMPYLDLSEPLSIEDPAADILDAIRRIILAAEAIREAEAARKATEAQARRDEQDAAMRYAIEHMSQETDLPSASFVRVPPGPNSSPYSTFDISMRHDDLTVAYRAALAARQEELRAARKAADAEERAAKEAKEAKEAAKEAAKLDYLRAWIAEHGDQSQIARSAEGLLCRDEAISALAEATFAALESAARRYTASSRPYPACGNEECSAGDCEIGHKTADTTDCLTAAEYASYQSIKTALPGAECVLRTHTAIHCCDHTPDCHGGQNHGCLVKVTVGPFVLQREYQLT